MNQQRYETYKDSGILWLGEIPAHWEVKKLGRLFQTIGSGTTPPSGEGKWYKGDIPWVTTSELREKIIYDTAKKVSQETLIKFPTLKVYSPRTILLAMYGATIGRLGILGTHACTNQACCALADPIHLDYMFAYYWLWGNKDQIINLSSGGGQPNINQDKVRELRVPVPKPPEQHAIAVYLDERIAKLDKLIANKREQIKQLETLRKVTIHDAVTKGLNPDAPMKDSGIPWLGEIPKHWQVKRISKIAALLQTGPFGSQLHSEEYVEHGIPIINPSHLVGGQIVSDPKVSVDSDVFHRLTRHAFEVGDIVFARRGEMGRCALVTEKETGWLCGTGSLLFRPEKGKVISEYMGTVLASKGIKDTLELTSVGSTMDNLNTDILGSIKVPLPPLDEQLRIDIEVKKKLVCIDQLRFNFTKQIKQIETLRKVTIHDAVTGNINVSGLGI